MNLYRKLAATPRERPAPSRMAAIRQIDRVAPQHEPFQQLVERGDRARDAREFGKAESFYRQALALFPLHGGYRVQYAHCLKEQERYPDAFMHYWYALGLGAPRKDVEEHALFAARHAEIRADSSDVARRAGAFSDAQVASSDWDTPPIEEDFLLFCDLFWGDRGLVNPAVVIPLLLTCYSRRALFLKFLGAPDTVRRNRSLLVMINRKGLPDV